MATINYIEDESDLRDDSYSSHAPQWSIQRSDLLSGRKPGPSALANFPIESLRADAYLNCELLPVSFHRHRATVPGEPAVKAFSHRLPGQEFTLKARLLDLPGQMPAPQMSKIGVMADSAQEVGS